MTPLTTSVQMGCIWIERDGDHIRVDAIEVPELIRSLRMHLDALRDAA